MAQGAASTAPAGRRRPLAAIRPSLWRAPGIRLWPVPRSRLVPIALAVVLFNAGASSANASAMIGRCDGTWHTQPATNPKHDYGDFDSLGAVAAVSSTDVWAGGSTDDFDVPPYGYRTLMEHGDGSRWSTTASPNSKIASWDVISGIAALATDDVWAVGSVGTWPYYSLVEHWDGAGWSIQEVGTPDTFLWSIAALGPDDIWAAGSTGYVGNGLLLHWDGATWNRTEIPQAIVFRSIAALGPDDIWAVGQESTAQFLDLTVAMHWDGATWTQFATPSPLMIREEDENWLTSVAAVATDDIWATGIARDPDWGIVDRPFTIHWDGTQWSMMDTPDPGGSKTNNDLWGVVANSSSDVWAVGSLGNEPNWNTFVLHWDGAVWTQDATSVPGRLLAVTHDPSGGLWAMGERSAGAHYVGTATLAQHRC